MCIIMAYKSKREKSGPKLSARDLANQYNKEVDHAPGQDKISDTFIEVCCTVWDRIFYDQECHSIILDCERELGKSGPFNSLYKLELFCRKCKDTAKLRWALKHVMHLIADKLIDPEMGLNELAGKKTQNTPSGPTPPKSAERRA